MRRINVAIIGAGNVGSTLGGALLRHEHEHFHVKYGVRQPSADKYHRLLNKQPGASLADVHTACSWGHVIILATPGSTEDSDIQGLASSLGDGVNGKVVIDATNPVSKYPDLEIRWQQGTSAGEVLAAALPHSFVYKAFNTIGAEHMAAADGSRIFADPAASGPLTMLFAGADNADHRSTVEAIIEGVGFSPRYLGPIRYARNLEAIAELYIHLGVQGAGQTHEFWGRDFHFQVVRKEA